jgi:hypothetical protein
MGCLQSSEMMDFDTIEPLVLRGHDGTAVFNGTTEHGRFQVSFFLSFSLNRKFILELDDGRCRNRVE